MSQKSIDSDEKSISGPGGGRDMDFFTFSEAMQRSAGIKAMGTKAFVGYHDPLEGVVKILNDESAHEGIAKMTRHPLRIGIVCYPTYGGSGAVATELGRLLARRGHTIHFISYDRPFRLNGDFHENIFHHAIGSESYPLFQGQLYTISAAVKMVDIIKNVGLDLLHLHYALPHAISAWMAMEMLPPERRVPTITTLHGTDITLVGARPSFKPAVKLGLDKSDHLTCVSQWLQRRTCETFRICDNMSVIYNFIDPEIFAPIPGCHHRDCFARPDEKIIMHISNFRPVKRVSDVVEVFARVVRRLPARLMMIGEGPDQEKAVALAEELGIADRVTFLGNQPGVAHFLQMADLFLFPSDGESFGLAALEAMACETPIVGARAGGLPEVLGDSGCGVLCEVGDVDGMAKAAYEILADDGRRGEMGRAARRRAVEHFSSDMIIPQYEDLYYRLLDERRARISDEDRKVADPV